MNVQPELLRHPKYKRLVRRVGARALEYLLQLWGHCQENQRGAQWGLVDAPYIEDVCGWAGEEGELWKALTVPLVPGLSPWVDVDESGNVCIHGWLDQNEGLQMAWENGRRGGRKPKNATAPTTGTGQEPDRNRPDNRPVNPAGTHGVTGQEPAGEPKNDMNDKKGINSPREGGEEEPPLSLRSPDPEKKELANPGCPPLSRAEFDALAALRGVPPDCAAWVWATHDVVGWVDLYGRAIVRVEPLLLRAASRWRHQDFRKKSLRAGGASMLDIKDRLAALREVIRAHPANPESGSHDADAPPELRAELRGLKKTVELLTREMAGVAA